ncbi:MAG: Gfo/Idh/MocA family oxidoreductase, partial [Fimbriimonadaceae bacterium]
AKSCTARELIDDPDIEIVVNLTVPKVHAPINNAVIEAGKHVYVEKPWATDSNEGRNVITYAQLGGQLTGAAPDTFLGAGIQTCREIIDSGMIGHPIGANAFMMCHGHESWHPAPAFYYEVGGGPLLDMGPYYLTALVNLMGPVVKVQGMSTITFEQRTITSEPQAGTKIFPETPTHIVGILEFETGAIGQVTMSFDVWHHTMPHIEIYGTEGSLIVPDPNGFGGPIKIRSSSAKDWEEVAIKRPYSQNSRGLGVLDMASALRRNRQPRASGELAFHVLEIMDGILEASRRRNLVRIDSHVDRPLSLSSELIPGDWIE